MEVDTNPAKSTFLEKLKLGEDSDPCWLPSRPWESIPSESGPPPSSPPPPPYRHDSTSSVSESSLVRLAMNALHGSESALVAIEELSMLFSSDSADRTSHKIPSLWSPALSTLALGNLLKYFGHFGCNVFLLRKFVDYFTSSTSSGVQELREQQSNGSDALESGPDKQTLVNQAFAVALGNVLDSYISSLNTLHASVSFRHSSKASHCGFLSSVGHSDITLLEVHLHSTNLRNQIEALGSICNIHDIALSFSDSPLRSLSVKASLEFNNYPRGGNLLTFLYEQLKVADPVHNSIIKYLFLRSLEPYCAFIRSWIFEGQICDPYNEFVVEYIDQTPGHKQGEAGFSTFSLATAKVRDGVAIPCFLEELLIPLFRAGQQLQVLMKLLELYNVLGACFTNREEILPHSEVFGSPLSFDKRTIETWVVERNSYYQRMLERVESFLEKFKFKAQQGSLYDIEFAHTKHKSILDLVDHTVDEALISLSDGADQNSYGNLRTEISETSSTTDESCYGDDSWDLSESESFVCSNEQSKSEPMTQNCSSDMALRQTYLSAIDFNFQTYNNSLRNSARSANLNTSKSMPSTTFEEKDTPYNGFDASLKGPSDTFLLRDDNEETLMRQHHACSIFSDLQNYVHTEGQGSDNSFLHNVGQALGVTNNKLNINLADVSNWGDPTLCANPFIAKGSESGHYLDKLCDSSSLLSLLSRKLIKHPNFFSMNPIFLKRYIMDSGGNHCASSGQPFPRYDFTTVKDPSKMSVDRLGASTTLPTGPVFLDTPKSDGTVHIYKPVRGNEKNEDTRPVRLDAKAGENLPPANTSGGGGWVSLLRRFGKVNDVSAGDPKTTTLVAFEIPLDFVIKKCMWEEISLQYRYVSNLTIKFLQEGFDLQEHLLALRRYHFMEVADWADLFIMSLWNHKHIMEADKRIPEIQGVLELSVRRSSCEGDTNKNRLYLYIKGHFMSSLPTLSTGIHSFDHLGLGYRVDWPLSIILTPEALKTYSEIFNFLIQVKLAAFFLTDSWCSLKKLVQLTKAIRRSDLQKEIVSSISILLETRHQVNHFVLMLQQYVQSQLSHVSWCRLLHSLKNKVKDMMDLESVHYQYLAESLHVCFLSDVTQPISTIIQSMLQCALDFRSCLIGSSSETGLDKEVLLSKLSQVDIHKVLLIKSTVVKNVKDLYILYLKSPKHGDSGISRFWDCLNYNEYYSELITKEVGHYTFSV